MCLSVLVTQDHGPLASHIGEVDRCSRTRVAVESVETSVFEPARRP